jgi:hypothetical protein
MSSLLGPSYDYWKSIKQPSEMGMSPGFSLDALATNVDGLLSYVELLIQGSGNASVTGKPLGNKFFLQTTGKCSETTAEKWKQERDEDAAWDRAYEDVQNKEGAKEITEDQANKLKNALNEQKKERDEKRKGEKKLVARWIYVNNIPDGSIPFIASGADGRTFDDLRGLIPGALGNLGALNPVQLFNGFTAGTYPDCAKVTLETVDNDNVRRSETRHVALVEMVEMNPCHFPGRYNPASGKSCQNRNEGMGNLAGSSGIAYQMSHRSPMSYTPASSELSFDTFTRQPGKKTGQTDQTVNEDGTLNAKEILDRHNKNVGTFYNTPVATTATASMDTVERDEPPSVYDEMIYRLSQLLGFEDSESAESAVSIDGESTDLSDIRGDHMSQVYYYGLMALLLYILYRMLYKKNMK